MRWVQRQGVAENFDVRVDIREGQALVQADVYDAQEHFVNHLDLQGSRVLTPSRQTLLVPFTPIAPGRYQGRFPVQGNGEYVLSLVGTQGDKTIGPKTVGLTLPYSAEYLGLDINYSMLNLLADRTGGQVLRADDAPEAADRLFMTQGHEELTALKEYWPWFVVLALGLFLVDIAVRQVFVPAVWTARWQRQSASEASMYTYDELEAIVHRRAEDHRRRSIALRETRHAAEPGREQAQYVTVASVRHRQDDG